jgi:pimeloyl-ACP methyl ester carboxylesterase
MRRTFNLVDPCTIRDGDGTEVVGTFRNASRTSGVVLVHGVLCDRSLGQIDRVAEALAPEHDTLAIDVLGHGDSPGWFTWGRDEWRQIDAAASYLANGGRSVTVIGFSFGGFHSARAASRGAPIDRLVLVGAPVDMRIHDHWPFTVNFWRHMPVMIRRRRRMTRLGLPTALRRSRFTDDELGSIRARTLVVHGDDDWLISRRHAERYAGLIPDATLCEIPGGFHAEFLLDSSPDTFIRLVCHFCGG